MSRLRSSIHAVLLTYQLSSPDIKKAGDKVDIYRAEELEHRFGLTQGELILVVLLAGGDYQVSK